MKTKLIKIISLLLIIILVFEIYTYGKSNKLYYVSIGDSLALGLNPYNEIGYGYTDYIKDYLKTKDKLAYYKDYSQSGYTTDNIKKDIKNKLELKKDLRESDIVTLSIGANDLLYRMDFRNFDISRILELKPQINELIPSLDSCLKEIRKYAKQKIIIIGYYNPIPFLFNTCSKELDILFSYIDEQYRDLSKKYKCEYISTYEVFKKNSKYLPNPTNIHPTVEGYGEIARLIINKLKV